MAWRANRCRKTMKSLLKVLGVITIVILIFLSWFFGFFSIVFYILGLYAALYFVSLLFKTTIIIDFILGAGIFILYVSVGISMLYWLYIILQYMFTENLILGFLLLVFGLPIIVTIQYALGFGVGAVLGGPLLWFRNDLEKRFKES